MFYGMMWPPPRRLRVGVLLLLGTDKVAEVELQIVGLTLALAGFVVAAFIFSARWFAGESAGVGNATVTSAILVNGWWPSTWNP